MHESAVEEVEKMVIVVEMMEVVKKKKEEVSGTTKPSLLRTRVTRNYALMFVLWRTKTERKERRMPHVTLSLS